MNVLNGIINQQPEHEVDPLTDTQPLERLKLSSSSQPLGQASSGDPIVQLEYGVSSDRGMRATNEDAALAFSFQPAVAVPAHPFSLFIVADGVGGELGGADASTYTVAIIAQLIMTELSWSHLYGKANDYQLSDIHKLLMSAITTAHRVIERKANGGATTATIALVLGGMAYLAHVGDSRAYYVTGDQIEQLTTDHTLVQKLKELGQISDEEAKNHPKRHVLSQAVGRADNLEIEMIARQLSSASHLILCTDGVWSPLDESQLASIVNLSATPQIASEALVRAAVQAGGTDNATAAVIRIL